MFKIEIEGEGLIFDDDLSFSLESPIFSDTISHSLQFSVIDDANGVNRRILGFINRADISTNQTRELSCTIVDGILSYTGTITAIWQGSKFVCYYKDSGDFWSAIKDKYLSDIPFDKIVFDQCLDDLTINDYIIAHSRVDVDQDYAFPVVAIGEKSNSEIDVKMNFTSINAPMAKDANPYIPVIPFFYLKFFYQQIFRKNGMSISDDIFSKNLSLKRLVMPNNYLINEFELNKNIVSSINEQIVKITNNTDPVVTTIKEHGLTNYQFVTINGISLVTTLDKTKVDISKRIFQVEVEDVNNFKLLGEDFSSYDEFSVDSFNSTNIQNQTTSGYAYFKNKTLQIDIDVALPYINYNAVCYLISDNYSGYVFLKGDASDLYSGTILFWDIDPSTVTFSKITLVVNKTCSLVDQAFSSYLVTERVINRIVGIDEYFRSINPSNHVPYLKINDFISECQKTFGVYPFIHGNDVKIKAIADILKSSDFIDISSFAGEITDIQNPALTGCKLTAKADSNDDFYKTMLPIQSIIDESKYTIKESVDTKDDLPVTSSETNDVRFVKDENAYYTFNKSFLNADNNWVFLCYNLLDYEDLDGDYIEGTTNISSTAKDLSIESAFSTLINYYKKIADNAIKGIRTLKSDLPQDGVFEYETWYVSSENAFYYNVMKFNYITTSWYWDWILLGYNSPDAGIPNSVKMDIPFANINFKNDVKMAPRLLYNLGVINNTHWGISKQFCLASGDISPFGVNVSPDADFHIRWDSLKGIRELFLKEYIYWQLNTRKDCKCIIQWPKSLLFNFDGSVKYRIRGIDYLVSEILYNNTKTGLTFGETTLVKV